MAPHSSALAWRIPWTEEPRRLQSVGSLRVGHDWATSLSLFTFMRWRRKWQHQYSCLENPRDGGAWWAAVYGVAQSRTRLKRLSSSSSSQCRRPGFNPWVRRIPWRRAWQTTCVPAWRIPWAEKPGGPQSRISKGRRRLKWLNTHVGGWFKCFPGRFCLKSDWLTQTAVPQPSPHRVILKYINHATCSLTSTIEDWTLKQSYPWGALKKHNLFVLFQNQPPIGHFYCISFQMIVCDLTNSLFFEEKCPTIFPPRIHLKTHFRKKAVVRL